VTDRLIDLGDEALRVLLGLALVDGLLLRLLGRLRAAATRGGESSRESERTN